MDRSTGRTGETEEEARPLTGGVRGALDARMAAHPWLCDPSLEIAAVGSTALYLACEEKQLPLPALPPDLDLAWRLSLSEGKCFLEEQGLPYSSTTGAEQRGTLGIRLDGIHIEITSYRGGGDDTEARLARDAALRDMTIGALYFRLWDRELRDPLSGLTDYAEGIIRSCGTAEDRIREHPIRAMRYLRKSSELGFRLERKTRDAIRSLGAFVAQESEAEAIAEEVRKALLSCPSPGIYFERMSEERLLPHVIPELAPQFDGRLAGRIHHHPESSQGLHMILVLLAARKLCDERELQAPQRLQLLLGALLHDLGKGNSDEEQLPSHKGHDARGVSLVAEIYRRLPGLGSKKLMRFCQVVARTHIQVLMLRRQKPGTLVRLWDEQFRRCHEDLEMLASVVRCDRSGRLRAEDIGLPRRPGKSEASPAQLEARLVSDLTELHDILSSVSGAAAKSKHGEDHEALREALFEARCKALVDAGYCEGASR